MSSVHELPPEMIASIIDMVTECESPIATLKALALVSKVFRPWAQKQLFSSVTIRFPDLFELPPTSSPGPHPAQPLVNALDLNPELARHIHHLSILDYSEDYWWSELDEEMLSRPDAVLPRLFNVISRHTSLKSFTLAGASDFEVCIGSEYSRDPLSWGMNCAILGLCVRAKVTEVNITLVPSIPLDRIVTLCPELKCLRLVWSGGDGLIRNEDVELELEEDMEETEMLDKVCTVLQVFDHLEPHQIQFLDAILGDPDKLVNSSLEEKAVCADAWRLEWHTSSGMIGVPQKITHLESLAVDERSVPCVLRLMDYELPGGTCAAITLSYLRELRVAGTSYALLALASDLISRASPHLQSFTWDMNANYIYSLEFTEETCLDLQLIPAMRTLRFNLLGNSFNEFTFLPCVVITLERLHRSEMLREVIISYSWSPFFPSPPTYLHGRGYIPESGPTAWATKLDALLSSSSSFPVLQKVVIVVAYVESRTVAQVIDRLDQERRTMAHILDHLDQERKTVAQNTDYLDEERRTVAQIIHHLDEERRSVVQIIDDLDEERRTVPQIIDHLAEERMMLRKATQRGLEEQFVGLRERGILTLEWVRVEKSGKWDEIEHALARFQ